jgi:hypothetical protein
MAVGTRPDGFFLEILNLTASLRLSLNLKRVNLIFNGLQEVTPVGHGGISPRVHGAGGGQAAGQPKPLTKLGHDVRRGVFDLSGNLESAGQAFLNDLLQFVVGE